MTNLGVPETCTWNDPMHELSTGEAQVRVSIWWIRFTRPEPRYKFLYGNVVPGRGPIDTNWTVTDLVGDDASFDDGPDEDGRIRTSKRRIVRRTITVQGKQAFALLSVLT